MRDIISLYGGNVPPASKSPTQIMTPCMSIHLFTLRRKFPYAGTSMYNFEIVICCILIEGLDKNINMAYIRLNHHQTGRSRHYKP